MAAEADSHAHSPLLRYSHAHSPLLRYSRAHSPILRYSQPRPAMTVPTPLSVLLQSHPPPRPWLKPHAWTFLLTAAFSQVAATPSSREMSHGRLILGEILCQLYLDVAKTNMLRGQQQCT